MGSPFANAASKLARRDSLVRSNSSSEHESEIQVVQALLTERAIIDGRIAREVSEFVRRQLKEIGGRLLRGLALGNSGATHGEIPNVDDGCVMAGNEVLLALAHRRFLARLSLTSLNFV